MIIDHIWLLLKFVLFVIVIVTLIRTVTFCYSNFNFMNKTERSIIAAVTIPLGILALVLLASIFKYY